MSYHFHEGLYRGPEALERLRTFPVTLCGAGALGANVAEGLARMGYGTLRVIDRDRIEERNLSTQPWDRGEVGALKTRQLAARLYRALGVEIDGVARELTASNVARLLRGSELVLDLFDNSVARAAVREYCAESDLPCLHVGLASDYAELVWNERYRVPSAAGDDVCDYPLSRTLVLVATGLACELVTRYVLSGEREDVSFTLGDFAVRPHLG